MRHPDVFAAVLTRLDRLQRRHWRRLCWRLLWNGVVAPLIPCAWWHRPLRAWQTWWALQPRPLRETIGQQPTDEEGFHS